MCDKDVYIGRQGLEIFKLACDGNLKTRKYAFPHLNKNADSLIDLLDPLTIWYPPPILSRITILQLEERVVAGSVQSLFKGIPCHSQAVERHDLSLIHI